MRSTLLQICTNCYYKMEIKIRCRKQSEIIAFMVINRWHDTIGIKTYISSKGYFNMNEGSVD